MHNQTRELCKAIRQDQHRRTLGVKSIRNFTTGYGFGMDLSMIKTLNVSQISWNDGRIGAEISPWLHVHDMGAQEYARGMRKYPIVFQRVHGYPLVSTDIHGSPWAPGMDSHGYRRVDPLASRILGHGHINLGSPDLNVCENPTKITDQIPWRD